MNTFDRQFATGDRILGVYNESPVVGRLEFVAGLELTIRTEHENPVSLRVDPRSAWRILGDHEIPESAAAVQRLFATQAAADKREVFVVAKPNRWGCTLALNALGDGLVFYTLWADIESQEMATLRFDEDGAHEGKPGIEESHTSWRLGSYSIPEPDSEVHRYT